jgi:hypothetical protein
LSNPLSERCAGQLRRAGGKRGLRVLLQHEFKQPRRLFAADLPR